MDSLERKTFFSLPPELRNIIYKLVADERPALTYRLNRKDYRCHDTDYKMDIERSSLRCLARFISCMPEPEYNAIKLNPHGVLIHMPLDLLDKTCFWAVRDWIVGCSLGGRLDSMTWDYEIGFPPLQHWRNAVEWFSEQSQRTVKGRVRLAELMKAIDNDSRLEQCILLTNALRFAEIAIAFDSCTVYEPKQQVSGLVTNVKDTLAAGINHTRR